MKRRICYVTGTRADFGLMEQALKRIEAHPELELGLCVTGMHLSDRFGRTEIEIERAGFSVWARIPVQQTESTGAEMAFALADVLRGVIPVLQEKRPEVLLVLGDRGEMLAAAIAALHLAVALVHIHGGERSGTIDESMRHAISKLAHFHFVATAAARDRLVRMGEHPERIFLTGAPGLDGLGELVTRNRQELCKAFGFNPARLIALVLYHPVVQDADRAGAEVAEVLAAIIQSGVQGICFAPNADAGGEAIRAELSRLAGINPDLRLVTHLAREEFISWLACADVMVGNSSSGIIEAASFGLRVVNVGDRQNGRERGGNVVDVPVSSAEIHAAINAAVSETRLKRGNIYGDGRAGERIADLLASLDLSPRIFKKLNAY